VADGKIEGFERIRPAEPYRLFGRPVIGEGQSNHQSPIANRSSPISQSAIVQSAIPESAIRQSAIVQSQPWCCDNGRVTQKGPVEPFDEAAAIARLERLRASIEAARQARQRKSDEFDAFVQSFRAPASAHAGARSAARTSAAEAPVPDAPPSAVASSIDAVDETPAPTARPVSNRNRRNVRLLGVGAVVAVIALGLLSAWWRKETPPSAVLNPVEPSEASSTQPQPEATIPAAPQSTPAATPQPVATAVVLDLRIVRPVWMRVIVDGRKIVEGVAQAGALRYSADRSIVVRVGNGGNVLVKNADREDPFGEADQPLTRTFLKR
jgi:hypothetical protein